ncbi:hypothetical protein FI667_g6226, partial [Globisporangium splendens]
METQVSEGMRALFEGQKKLHESILKVQQQIEEEEAAYLEETPHGNIIRGWDGFIDSKQPRKDAATKKIKPYTDAEHLFSSCCFYASLGQEPTVDLVDPAVATVTEEAPSRRKLSTASTATGGASGSTAGTPSANGTGTGSSGSKLSSLQRSSSVSERKGSFLGSSGKGGKGGTSVSKENANAAATGKASKLKKRKREKLDDAEETGDDGKAATKATTTTTDSADDDFVDDF